VETIIEIFQAFNENETEHILGVKEKLKSNLSDFNLTIGKLHNNFTRSYFVTGGCIGSLLRNETPKDYDIYFFAKFKADAVINLYTNDKSYMDQVAVAEDEYRNIKIGEMVITENATTLKNGLQLITKNYGEPQDIRKTFDFIHCLPYYDPRDDKLYISREQYDLNMNKKIKANIHPELIAVWRVAKYQERGFTWL
jgi:ornithine carbamoyltransferase